MINPSLNQIFKSIDPNSLAIIGLGNPDRADDGVGLSLVSQIKARFPERAFLETDKSAEGWVLQLIENNDIQSVLFVDAADFGGKPGDYRLFSSKDIENFVPTISTHKVSISLLMSVLSQHQKEGFLLGIQPESIEFLGDVSDTIIRIQEELYSCIITFLDYNN